AAQFLCCPRNGKRSGACHDATECTSGPSAARLGRRHARKRKPGYRPVGRKRRFRAGRASGADALPHPDFIPSGTPSYNSRMRRACAKKGARMKTKQFYRLLAGMLVATAAHAQQQADIKADEVVVTATRFEEKASDQPVNVQVITAEQIRQSGARTLPELL